MNTSRLPRPNPEVDMLFIVHLSHIYGISKNPELYPTIISGSFSFIYLNISFNIFESSLYVSAINNVIGPLFIANPIAIIAFS